MQTLHIKTLNEAGKFLYSASLLAFIEGESRQIARVDNYHKGRRHHVHLFRPGGSEEKKDLDIKGVSEAIDWLVKNQVRLILEYTKR